MADWDDIEVDRDDNINDSVHCHICNTDLSDDDNFGEHTAEKHPLQCGICKIKLSTPIGIIKHIRTSHNEIIV